MRCLTQQVRVDDLEAEEDGIAEMVMGEDAMTDVARPGTSLRTGLRSASTSQAMRPVTQSGRPITGVFRPGTQGRPETVESALRAPRTAKTARPMTSSSGRFVRLGTASMVASDGPFINLRRVNVSKYARDTCLSRPLFEYIVYNENEIRLGLEVASEATKESEYRDWWWKLQLGKCYYKIGLMREAERQLRSCLKDPMVTCDPFLWLGKVFIRMDQPLSAMEVYREGMDRFPRDLHIHLARIHEALNEHDSAASLYRHVLHLDPTNVEAVACIAMHMFYTEQPEVALRLYRRILQMAASCEVYNNLGLCCYYSQQYDMALTCFERALLFSDSDETTAEVWYNLSHIALGTGDRKLADQTLRLAIVANNVHAEAYNNLAAIEGNKKNSNFIQVNALFLSASNHGPHLFEPRYNLAVVNEKIGKYDPAFVNVKQALKLYPEYYSAQDLFQKLRKLYENV